MIYWSTIHSKTVLTKQMSDFWKIFEIQEKFGRKIKLWLMDLIFKNTWIYVIWSVKKKGFGPS